jgi:23S rRNA pseudouridine955/2504/2580 synthase
MRRFSPPLAYEETSGAVIPTSVAFLLHLPMLTMIAAPDVAGRRLDRLLRKALPGLPLSALHRLLRKRRVLLDGKSADASTRINAGAVITVLVSDTIYQPERTPTPQTPLAPESILWQGSGLLILNKPAGIATHGEDSLETRVSAFLADKLPPSLSFKSGPLHRLDTPTSGVIVFSTSLEGARHFSALIREQRARKRYIALVDGRLNEPARWEDALVRDKAAKKTYVAETDAARAETAVYPLASNADCSLIMAEISTGKTHQIRAQAAFHGHPLSGDGKYGGSALAGGLLLHAYSLEFPAPTGELLLIKAPLPRTFYRRITARFGTCPELP